MFFRISSRLPLLDFDSYNLLEALFTCNLNQTFFATVFCLKNLLVDINLYELVYLIEDLFIAVSVNRTETPVVA